MKALGGHPTHGAPGEKTEAQTGEGALPKTSSDSKALCLPAVMETDLVSACRVAAVSQGPASALRAGVQGDNLTH